MFAFLAALTACTVSPASRTTALLASLEPISTPPTILAPIARSLASPAAHPLSVPHAHRDIP